MRENAYQQLEAAYLRYLGRKGTPDEYESHFGGDYSSSALDRAVGFVSRSPEATEYANRPATPPPTPSTHPDSDPFETRPKSGDFARTLGFDQGQWGTMNSVRYRAAEILSRYPPTPEGLKQGMNDPDFKKLFPKATLASFDTIDFGGMLSEFDSGVPVGKVDVGKAFDVAKNTGDAWVWQDFVNNGASMRGSGASDKWKYRPPAPTPDPPPGAPPGVPPGSPAPPDPSPGGGNDLLSMNDFASMHQRPSALTAQNPDDLFMSDLERQRASRIGKYGRA